MSTHFSCTTDNPSRTLVKKVKSILEVVSAYKYGDSRSWLQEYNDIMVEVYNMPEVYENVEQLMLDVLKSKTSHDAKLLVCKSLGTMGSNASITVLNKMLDDPSTTPVALIALTTIPGNEVDNMLVNAMQAAENDQLMGIMNTLALRKCSEAVQSISKYLNNDNSEVATASIMALGNIAGEEATALLHEAFIATDGEHKWKIAEGLLNSLENLKSTEAINYYNDIYDADPPLSIKYGAFKGMVYGTDDNNWSQLILNTFLSSDEEFQETLIPLIRNLPANAKMDDFIESMSTVSGKIQDELMLAISDRKDKSVRPLVLTWIKSEDPAKRWNALKSLKTVSEPGDIQLLASLATKSSEKEKELARSCLYWMEGEDVNTSVLSALENSGDLIKPELIRCVGYRKIEEGNELVVGYLHSTNTMIRKESIQTLGKIGTKNELNNLLDWAVIHASKKDIELLIASITAIGLNFANQEEAIDIINDKLGNATFELPKIMLIEVLGHIGGDYAFRLIQPFITSKSPDLQFTALKVLSSWQNDLPLIELELIIQSDLPQKNRSQAIAGITYLVQNSTMLNEDQKAARLESAFALVNSGADKKIIIHGISRIESLVALDFVTQQLNDPEIQSEVQDAIIRIAGNLRNYQPEKIKNRMDSLIENTDSEEFKEKIDILQKSMEL